MNHPIQTIAQLEDALSEPSEELIRSLAGLSGDLLILGAGGKMGPTFARMARRALDTAKNNCRVIAVSRFSNESLRRELASHGIEVLCGNLFRSDFVRGLPDAQNVLYLVGQKFGTSRDASHTWASNTYIAGLAAERFRNSRIVALSTGNIYGLVPIDRGNGSTEDDEPRPDGEYSMSAVGRERVFEHFCMAQGTRTAIARLNYATELRYGVLVDLAQKVFRGEPISLTMGYFNTIWQRDACDTILRLFQSADVPPNIWNITGLERLSVREIALRFGQLFDRTPQFVGVDSDTALLSNATAACNAFGAPPTSVEQMVDWIADWIRRGGETWNKPTHFEVRDGRF
jgi:nucleoside-diphosphate-sugar epimerase